MLSYRGLLDDASKTLYHCSETPRIDAEYLLQHVVDKSLAWLISYGDQVATVEHTLAFQDFVQKRAEGIPVAYLLGYREFWTLKLRVNDHVLIPRGDTEILVEQALSRIGKDHSQTVLDLGTGSGAIALSVAKERPQSEVIATDSSELALEVAKANARSNQIENVSFVVSDWFCEINSHRFDVILSNPPYVHPEDPHLNQGDLRFEPLNALVSGSDGMKDLELIISQSPRYLTSGGWVVLEHGYDQAEAVRALLSEHGFSNIDLYADLNHLPRCTAAQKV